MEPSHFVFGSQAWDRTILESEYSLQRYGMARSHKIKWTEPSHFDGVATADGDWVVRQWWNKVWPLRIETWAQTEPEWGWIE